MAALTDDQVEILQRAWDNLPLWGGSAATERLSREVDLLFALGLIEPCRSCPYRLTALGAQILNQLTPD